MRRTPRMDSILSHNLLAFGHVKNKCKMDSTSPNVQDSQFGEQLKPLLTIETISLFIGFRKVDSDRWEFAHVSFLRGQTQLLRRIVRRNSGASGGKKKELDEGEGALDDDNSTTMVAMEVVRLKKEQCAIDEKVALMWQRVKETERRPKQMLAFLVKVVGDAQMLQQLVGPVGDDGIMGGTQAPGEKRARLSFDDATNSGHDGNMNSWPLDIDQGVLNDSSLLGFGDLNVSTSAPTVDSSGFLSGDGGGYGGGYDPYHFQID